MIESSNGAKASAILYSLVETAKANMINTFEYFNLLLTEIPQHMDDKDLRFIDDLLPWSPRVQKECPSRYKKSWFFNVHIYSVKSAQSPLECGDFWYPVLMFEDLRSFTLNSTKYGKNQLSAYDKNVPLETARYGRGYEVNTEFNLQWNCSRWEL